MSILRMEWRVTDPDLPQGELKGTGPLKWSLQYGKYPILVAQVPVVIR